jgi:L-asparagine transporter-like permease
LVSKLVLVSVALIAVGLVLVVISDPLLRAVTGSGGFTPGTGTGTFTGNFTRGNFTSGQFTTFRRGGAGLIGTTAYESLAGIGLVGAGLLLEVFSLFIRASPAKPPT